jgi:hypothetical protein
MGKSSSPDYTQAAMVQAEMSEDAVRDQTYSNRPDQYTPFGYTTWDATPGTDPYGNPITNWTQVSGLTPELQEILNKQTAITGAQTDVAGQLTGRMGSEFGEAMDWSGFTDMGYNPTTQFTLPENLQRGLDYSGIAGVNDPNSIRSSAEDLVYDTGAARLQEQFTNDQQALEIKLRNQGLSPEDAAWQSQMGALGQQENDAYNQLQLQALTQGQSEAAQMYGQEMGLRDMYTGEADRMADFYNTAAGQDFSQNLAANAQNYGQAMQQSQYANQIRQQEIAEAMSQRGQSLNEINALLSGQQVGMPSMPNFAAAAASDPANIYQATVDQGNYNQAGTQGLWSGLTDLASAYIGG